MLHSASKQVRAFPDIDALKAFIREHPLQDCTILIKGSNGNHMTQITDTL